MDLSAQSVWQCICSGVELGGGLSPLVIFSVLLGRFKPPSYYKMLKNFQIEVIKQASIEEILVVYLWFINIQVTPKITKIKAAAITTGAGSH